MTRIVIDPESLRMTASRIRGAATLLSSSGRQLASRPLPAMPAGLAPIVSETVARAGAELHDLGAGLVRDAGLLYVRATWAEADIGSTSPWTALDGDDWSDAAAPDEPADAQPPRSDSSVEAAEVWSLELVDSSLDAATASGEAATSDVSELRSLVAADLAADPHRTLRSASLSVIDLSGAGFDLFTGIGETSGPPSASGAAGLGNALDEMAESAMGLGVLGCITVGVEGAPEHEQSGDAS